MTLFPQGKLYINGKLRSAAGEAKYEDIGPWTGEVIAYAADASAEDMDEAIASARRAFDDTDWSRNAPLRRELVKKFVDGLRAKRATLTEIARHEVGAGLGSIALVQVDVPLDDIDMLFDIFDTIEWEKSMGDRVTWGVNSRRLMVKEAAGVVAVITPWNVPLYITMGKVLYGLLSGCTVIVKPAPETPLLTTIFGEVAAEIGFPPGVLNVVTGKDPAFLGEMLVDDKRVDVVSFTGSTGVGKRIMERGAATLKRVALELGGKSAMILLDDAPDFAEAVSQSIICFHAGQGCTLPTRLLVPRSRYAEVLASLEAAYAAYSEVWGIFDAPTNLMGPLISARQRDRVMGYIESGKAQGARLLAGGNATSDKGAGFFVEPTCFVDVTNDMKIAREEIFGPVLVVITYEDEEDAIRIANDSDYGLFGAVCSGDPERAMRVARRIRSGIFSINGGIAVAMDLPFGGYKQSGLGKEWGLEGFSEFLETKVIAIAI